jgi:hypothetical protein
MPESAYERARRFTDPTVNIGLTADQYVAHHAYDRADSKGHFYDDPDLEKHLWGRVVEAHTPVYSPDYSPKQLAAFDETARNRHADFLQAKYGGKDPGFSETSSYTNN